MATLVDVTWIPADVPGVQVEYGDGMVVEGEAGHATLFGLHANTAVSFRLVVDDWQSDWFSVTTGKLPADVPRFTVVDEGDPGVNFVAGSHLITPDEGSAVWVVDREGEVVWYDVLQGIGTVPVIHKVDGGFLYLVTSHSYLGEAHARWVSADNRKQDVFPLPMAHHDLLELPDGTLAAVVGEARLVDGDNVVGDGIVELSSDGSTRTVWSAFDHFEVEENDGWGALAYPEGADWTHANGLDYDPTTDNYLFSMYRCECIASINRTTGATNWILGGGDALLGTGLPTLEHDEPFGPQHAPRWVNGGVLMFDNGYDIGVSRLLQFEVDGAFARKAWTWEQPGGYATAVLGDVDEQADGGHLSSWGTLGEIVSTGPDDQIRWRIDVDPGHVLGQVSGFDAFE